MDLLCQWSRSTQRGKGLSCRSCNWNQDLVCWWPVRNAQTSRLVTKLTLCSRGSSSNAATVDIYDVSTATWNSTALGAGQLSVARYQLCAGAIGNKIVVAGGSSSTGIVDTVDVFDVDSGSWQSTATGVGQLSLARAFMASASTGTKIVFAGGRSVFSAADMAHTTSK